MKIRIVALAMLALLFGVNVGAQSAKPVVIASHSILADVARNVAGDHLEIRSLIPVGSDPHTFIPTPGDLAAVADADLVLINGMGYEESLLDAIESAGESVRITVASACIDIRPLGAHEDEMHDDDDEHAHEDDDDHEDETGHDDDEMHEDDDEHAHEDEDEHAHEDDDDHAHEDEDEHAHEDDDEHAHEDDDEHAHEDEDAHAHEDDDDHAHEEDDDHAHEDELTGCDAQDAEFHAIGGHGHGEFLGRAEDIECEAHDHGHESGEDDHGEGGCDPHIWFDPHNVIHWALTMRDSFSTIDPDHASDYHERTLAYAAELVSLEEEVIMPLLDGLPAERRVLMTAHDALGYLAGTFDFEIVSTVIPGVSTAVEPSARDVAELIDLIRERELPAIFGESTTSDKVLQTIAQETGVEIVPLYTDSLGEVAGPAGAYLDYMRYNFSAIIEALSG